MEDSEVAERIARLEERMLNSMEDRKELWDRIDGLVKAQESLTAELHKIVLEMGNWKGKLGGIMFAAGCIWAFITVAWNSIAAYVKFTLEGGA